MVQQILSGVMQGLERGAGLLVVAGIAYTSFKVSFSSFRKTRLYGPLDQPKRLAESFRHALFWATLGAILITIFSGYAPLPNCTPDFADGEVTCSHSIPRSAEQVVATFVTALILLVGPVIGARMEYSRFDSTGNPPGA